MLNLYTSLAITERTVITLPFIQAKLGFIMCVLIYGFTIVHIQNYTNIVEGQQYPKLY